MLLAGCDWGADIESDEPSIIQTSDVQVVGASEALASVLDMMVLADGTVWALNSAEPLFIRFPGEGDAVSTRGQSGGGPGEFGRPAGFVVEGERTSI